MVFYGVGFCLTGRELDCRPDLLGHEFKAGRVGAVVIIAIVIFSFTIGALVGFVIGWCKGYSVAEHDQEIEAMES